MVRNLFLIITIFLTQCSVVPIIPIAIDDIVLKVEETKEKKTTSTKLIEKPYQINGKWFYPRDYKFFEEIGIANTLNDIRTGDKTRNGEVYHDEIMMGSHRSLPLPSLIKVTNLSNGYSVRVRVNHRGAFSNTNVINLSSAVFDILDMKKSGELVKISLIYQNETFFLNEAYTYDEEKKVAEAPISSVEISDINEQPEDELHNELIKKTQVSLDGFEILSNHKYESIYINIATFSFKKNAENHADLLNIKHDIKVVEVIDNGGVAKYKVVIGPFKDIDNLLRILNDDTFDKYEDLSIFLM